MAFPTKLGEGEFYELRAGEHVVTCAKTRRWRKQVFVELGFTMSDAELLSRLRAADPHDIGRWLEQKCTHEQAVAIVAPIDPVAQFDEDDEYEDAPSE